MSNTTPKIVTDILTSFRENVNEVLDFHLAEKILDAEQKTPGVIEKLRMALLYDEDNGEDMLTPNATCGAICQVFLDAIDQAIRVAEASED